MTVLDREQRQRAQRARLTQQALYRNELREVANHRASALEEVASAEHRLTRLLPGALAAGVPMTEAAGLTGLSRPTLYRMLAVTREGSNARSLMTQIADALADATQALKRAALRHDLAQHMRVTDRQLTESLVALLSLALEDVNALGPLVSGALIDLLPGLPKAEKIAVNMAVNQREDLTAIEKSMQMPQAEVAAHLALGLLRVLPDLRATLGQ